MAELDANADADGAVADIAYGDGITVGGFGLWGILSVSIDALLERVTTDLDVLSNNRGVDDPDLNLLLAQYRTRRTAESYVGENRSARAISTGCVDSDMSGWAYLRIDPPTMIRPRDIVELVRRLTLMSRRALFPCAPTLPGSNLWRA